jgi:hypothetical protein
VVTWRRRRCSRRILAQPTRISTQMPSGSPHAPGRTLMGALWRRFFNKLLRRRSQARRLGEGISDVQELLPQARWPNFYRGNVE